MGNEQDHEGPLDFERIRAAVLRLVAPPDCLAEDRVHAAEEVQRLLEQPPAVRYPAFFTRGELARPAIVEALLHEARDAITLGSERALELARLALVTTSRFSGEHYPSSLTIDYLGESWLVLAVAHLERRRLSEARQAFDVGSALLVRGEGGTGDACLAAELLLTEGLLEFAGGNGGGAMQSLQGAVQGFAALGDPPRARVAARLLAEVSAGGARASRSIARSSGSERRAARGPLSHVRAAWRSLVRGA